MKGYLDRRCWWYEFK
ncbi:MULTISPECIES: hypothetical protein [Bacillus]